MNIYTVEDYLEVLKNEQIPKCEKNIFLVCKLCGLVYRTESLSRIKNASLQEQQYFLVCRSCKSKIHLEERKKINLEKRKLLEQKRANPEYRAQKKENLSKAQKRYNIEKSECKKNIQITEKFDDIIILKENNKKFIRFICEDCKKERIESVNSLLLRGRFECKECVGLDTIEHRTGFRGNLANPKNLEKLDDACLTKLGVKRSFLRKDIRDKADKTYFDKYGDKSYHFVVTSRQTIKERYDVENVGQLNFVKDKIRNTVSTNRSIYLNQVVDNLFDLNKFNRVEYAFYKTCLENKFLDIIYNDRSKISPYEIDFLINGSSGIEINGVYWHSTIRQKNIKYHYMKYSLAKKAAIKLYQFYDIEIQKYMDVLLSYIIQEDNRNFFMSDIDSADSYNMFNISFIENNIKNYMLIKDSLQGEYSVAQLDDELISVFSNNSFCNYRSCINYLLDIGYKVLIDNRLISNIDLNCIIEKKIDPSFKQFGKLQVYDAGYKIIYREAL